MTANTGHAWERIYEPDRDLIATVHNRYGNRTISRFDYTNDEIGRRVARADSGEAFSETAFERYAYNDRSGVIGSQRFYGSNISDLSRPVTGRTFGYGYDPIGNRVSSYEDAGGRRLTTTYEANELNQYTSIQSAGAVPLRGDAAREATVSVNGALAERDGGTAAFTPWSFALASDVTTAHYQNADILAVAQNVNGEDAVQSKSGSVFMPASETNLEYDDDGNMTFDGRFRYAWNGENRMIRAVEALVPTNRPETTIGYAYDHQGRMVTKNIAGTNTVARSLRWDDYNIVRELDNGIATHNIWGLDLDGTLQGCGGVGGLLAVAKTNGLHVGFYDANGNVSEYAAPDGTIAAHYEYSPFGEPLVSSGGNFTHQFSTKPWCTFSGMNEFQYLKYCLNIGRWMSRDPLGEKNMFEFCKNTILGFDELGLFSCSSCCPDLCSLGSRNITEIDVIILPNGRDPNNQQILKQFKPYSKISNIVTSVGDGISVGLTLGPAGGIAAAAASGILLEFSVSPIEIANAMDALISESSIRSAGAQIWTKVIYSGCQANHSCALGFCKRNDWGPKTGNEWRICGIGSENIGPNPFYANANEAQKHVNECLAAHLAAIKKTP